ncbi:hypothetical protein SLS63_004371 [Diaporthe eres]|uniref:Uncharacterized protein n=1 Tax=Diaporthe eres TaxID=83184 RepID=A0ABR1PDT0_DIAER
MVPLKTPRSKITIVESDDDDDDDEDWRPKRKQPTNTNQPGTASAVNDTTSASNTSGQPPGLTGNQGKTNPPAQPPQVGNTTTPLPPVQVPSQLPTPPQTGPSNKKQGVRADAGTSTGGPGYTTPTPTRVTLPPFPEESEILELYRKLQEMVFIWVEECLPDTFPDEFKTQRPERYWELCGWCQPVSLGDSMLSKRAWAKYVYESWVWRFFYQEIFRPGSLTWAGNDLPREEGGADGMGKAVNDRFGWLITEMLVAFHPYFSDAYKPIAQPQNIEVLIRDTRFLIVKARELDERLRSARHLYDLILGKEGEECRISGVESPAIVRYEVARNESRTPIYFDEHTLLALIVVPGLIRFGIEEALYGTDDTVTKSVVRHARAFAQTDLLEALRT